MGETENISSETGTERQSINRAQSGALWNKQEELPVES